MTIYPSELAGLPEGGPAGLPAVKLQLSIATEDTRDDARLQAIIDATNAMLRRYPSASIALQTSPASWPADFALGAAMLCARLFKRRNSPAGVEAMGQLGAAYVMRNDPDIAQLLRIGSYARPGLG